jgi:hypothetical protein
MSWSFFESGTLEIDFLQLGEANDIGDFGWIENSKRALNGDEDEIKRN